ncbi:MAG: alpha/beta hydrolase [Salibacteraceae bacterium]
MSSIQHQELLIPSAFGKSMAADLSYTLGCTTLAIYAHGINGFKDWGGMELIADEFAANNCAFLKFNFSHNGTSLEEVSDFVDLEAYAKDNYSIRQSDLKQVLNYVLSDALPIEVKRIVLIGHSRGGVDTMIFAANSGRVDGLVTWAAPDNANTPWSTWDAKRLKQWKKTGRTFLKNGRTGQDMPLDYQLFEDFSQNASKYDPKQIASQITIPWLIVHGAEDTAVSVDEAKTLSSLQPMARLVILPEAGHTFDRSHPLTEPELPAATRQLITQTLGFI